MLHGRRGILHVPNHRRHRGRKTASGRGIRRVLLLLRPMVGLLLGMPAVGAAASRCGRRRTSWCGCHGRHLELRGLGLLWGQGGQVWELARSNQQRRRYIFMYEKACAEGLHYLLLDGQEVAGKRMISSVRGVGLPAVLDTDDTAAAAEAAAPGFPRAASKGCCTVFPSRRLTGCLYWWSRHPPSHCPGCK